ncbi:MAG: hypothetical protein A2W91_13605 [Bacteroidetes bacterium GWF2_38_335]|nr:MAG: hypothetical protein A2W91_13605 [Bacteroidetes bacterium GWF2_38_335]OFY77286.1 MAG: hypothetical protein A2281_15270 [Bacteroidetes bacterium RIFOXYA12_FULL_38_20]HBS85709.1 hypothetical protein [Bacteroidales bacterium]
MSRLCLNCNEPVLGRTDKKFCTDFCRNIFNNRKNQCENLCIKETNKILKKNHSILTGIAAGKRKKIKKTELERMGFNFCFHTGIQTKKGKTQFVCYDKGFMFSGEDTVILSEMKSQNI